MPACKIALGLACEPSPQMVGNDETEYAIAEEFETLVTALDGRPTPMATTFGDERARMGQCLFEELAAGELVTDDMRERLRRQNPSLPTACVSSRRGTAGYSESRTAISRTPTAAPTRRSKKR